MPAPRTDTRHTGSSEWILNAAPNVLVREVDALHGIGIDPLVEQAAELEDLRAPILLRGNPPVGTCTVCVGKKEIGWQAHFGVVMQVDAKTGVMTWCVTGPLGPRQRSYKDIGYYSAEGYEGLVRETQSKLQVGRRYWFQPRMCMLQWRHSGLLNYLSRNEDGHQVRLEGLWIG